MMHRTLRIAGCSLAGLLLALTVHAAGGSSKQTPATPDKSPQQLADQYYNEGLVYRDKAWKLEEQWQKANETDRAKIEKKIAKNYQRAIASYKDALANSPEMHEAASSMGYALRKTGKYEDALTAYDKALSIQPDYAEAIEYRGEAYLGLNRIEEAKQAYMALFAGDRTYADELLEAMRQWVDASPTGVDGATVEEFSSWIDERAEIAGNTTPVSQLREKSW